MGGFMHREALQLLAGPFVPAAGTIDDAKGAQGQSPRLVRLVRLA